MLFWIYWLLALTLLGLVGVNLWCERDWRKQFAAAIVLVPLIMRVLLIK